MKQHLYLIIIALLTMAMGAKAEKLQVGTSAVKDDGTSGIVEINETNFPDAAFRSFLLAQSYGKDGVLSDSEIAGITTLNLQSRGIANLSGINYFTALKELRCYWNKINGSNMDELIASLPQNTTGEKHAFYVVYNITTEGNICTKAQAAAAKARGWTPCWFDGSPYEGTDFVSGDVNHDGHVNSADVQKTYALMASGKYIGAADHNHDGFVNSADVQRIYSFMAGR